MVTTVVKPEVSKREKVKLTPKKQLREKISSEEKEVFSNPKGTENFTLLPEDKDTGMELIQIEKIINQRHFGEALKRLENLDVPDSSFQEYYQARIVEKKIRTLCRIAITYANQGKKKKAKQYYDKALAVKINDSKAGRVALKFIDKFVAEKTVERERQITEFVDSTERGIYSEYCEKKKKIKDNSLINDLEFRNVVDSNNFIAEKILRKLTETGKAQQAVYGKKMNWIHSDPETWGLDVKDELAIQPFANVDTAAAVISEVEVSPTVSDEHNKLQATFAMPLIRSRLRAHTESLANNLGVDATGRVCQIIPLYRYKFLREQCLSTLDKVSDIEHKMLFLQTEADDFAEFVKGDEKLLADKQAELASIEEQISEAVMALGEMGSVRSEISTIVNDLSDAKDDCDVEWWEVLLGIALFFIIIIAGVVVGALAGAGIGFLLGGPAGAAAGAEIGMFAGFAAGTLIAFEAVEALGLWEGREITCDNVNAAHSNFSNALTQVNKAIQIGSAELQIAMVRRDLLQAEIAVLSNQIEAKYEDNSYRHLNADTIANILNVYEDSRYSLLNRATILAQNMEASYRFEYGQSWKYFSEDAPKFIADSYDAFDGKGYGAREELLKDIEAVEFERLHGKTHKAMQLTLPISLRRHFPTTLTGVKAGGKASFTLSMEKMDQFYPGTFQHRIKEVKVDVLVNGQQSAARGYLSCYGPSQIRFPDPGNKYPTDNNHIITESNQDIAKLCYKRTWQVGGRESMAFPDLNSTRANDRIVNRQQEERNFFENLGMGVTWLIELLPDQNIDMTNVSDILITYQIEANFDDNLRKVIEEKRFDDRDEIIAFSAKQMIERQKRNFDLKDIQFKIKQTSLPHPYKNKKIKNIAVYLKPKLQDFIDGCATISVSLNDTPKIQVKTDEQGRAATGNERHAGPDGDKLKNSIHGKDPVGNWGLSLDQLPAGFDKEDIEDMYLLLRYSYA